MQNRPEKQYTKDLAREEKARGQTGMAESPVHATSSLVNILSCEFVNDAK